MTSETSLSQAINLERLVNPTERQRDFLRAIADYDYVLYGGAAGGGKSYILRWWLVIYLIWVYRALGIKRARVGLFCEDYPALEDRHLSKIRAEFPSALGTVKNDGRDFILRDCFGGGSITFRNLDDTSKYQSAEFAGIAVDELTRNSKEVFDFLRFRLRWPGIERPKFAGATNPGGIGHAWVKKLWIDRDFPSELLPLADQFAFVQAKAADNPHLNSSYYRSLLTLPPEMARKYADGDWDVYTGQFFAQFDHKRHVRPAAEMLREIKPWHAKWLAGDWGYEHPHAIYKFAQDERKKVRIYGELWDRHVSETELGHRITKFCGDRDKFDAFAFSWDAGKQSPRSQARNPKSMRDLLAEALGQGIPKPYPADSSPGSRVSRARLFAQMLDSNMVEISDACPRLIACLPTLVRAENNPEDVEKVDYSENEIGDDPYDGASMGLQHMVVANQRPFAEVMEERLASIPDNTNKHLEHMRLLQQHKHDVAPVVRRRNWRQ